jgi:hypothetical protein
MLKQMLLRWIQARLGLPTQTAPVQTAPESQPEALPKPAFDLRQPIRAMSAVEILQNEPNLTPAELAERAGVTLSYARSLVRRRQNRASAPVVWPVAPRTAQTALSSRTQVLDRSASGAAVDAISEDLGIPEGEVEFILKVDRIKKTLKN